MTTLATPHAIIYYDDNGRCIYWPGDTRPDVLKAKLLEARANGFKNARIAEVK